MNKDKTDIASFKVSKQMKTAEMQAHSFFAAHETTRKRPLTLYHGKKT